MNSISLGKENSTSTKLDDKDWGSGQDGGEVARYTGRHGTKRVAKPVLTGAVTPLMLKTVTNPAGLPIESFHEILADRSQFFQNITTPFSGANSPNNNASQGLLREGLQKRYREIQRADTDPDPSWRRRPSRNDRRFGPSLSSKIAKGATRKTSPGAPHGKCSTLKDQVNEDLLACFKV